MINEIISQPTVKEIFAAWQNGELYDSEAICQIIACPPRPTQSNADAMAEQLESIAEIARAQGKIMRERNRAKFLTFIEERLCVEGLGASLSAQIIEVLMAAWDRDEIVWQFGNLDFTFIKKGE